MEMLLESPLPVIVMGIVVEAILGVVYVNNRRRGLIVAMAGVLLVVAAGVVVERWVMTDREKVAATLDGAAAALESNDLDRVLQFIDPEAEKTIGIARANMLLVTIHAAKVNNLQIEINRFTSPPIAETKFVGVVDCEGSPGVNQFINRERYFLRFQVELVFKEGRWLIADNTKWQPLRM
jgi:hypothetical protein